MSRSARPSAFDLGLSPRPAGAPAQPEAVWPGQSFLALQPHDSPSGARHRASPVFSGHPWPGPAARFLLALRPHAGQRRPFPAGSSLRSSGHPWPRHPCRPAVSCRGIHAAASGCARTRVHLGTVFATAFDVNRFLFRREGPVAAGGPSLPAIELPMVNRRCLFFECGWV